MKVGLVRHFKVQLEYPDKPFVTPDEVTAWFDQYDLAGVDEVEVDLGGVAWKRCYASDLPRAVKTAQRIYPGEVIIREELREIPVFPLIKRQVKLPFLAWAVLVRLAWLVRHKSQQENMAAVKERINAVLDEILSRSDEDVLIVSHAALMIFLRKELLRRGFTGPSFRTAENGKLYLFER